MHASLRVAAAAAVVALNATAPSARTSAAGLLGSSLPSHCVEHTTFEPGRLDAVGDYRCAGVAIDFHHAGPRWSPHPLWAGQWLFVDEAGQYRVGSCTFQRGVHPTTLGGSVPVGQEFLLDRDGRKRAYLTWRHGETTDGVTAAALWAVFHFYAQDAAGPSRSEHADEPLVPDLGQLAEMTGWQQLEDLAISLDAEATQLSGPPAITLTAGPADAMTALVVAGAAPLHSVSVTLSSAAESFRLVTGPDGTATAEFALGDAGGVVTAVASVAGDSVVYAGPPAMSDDDGVQTLLTAGPPTVLQASVERAPVPTTTTTTIPPTTTTLPTTTIPPTTTTLPETTTLPPETTTSAPAPIAPPTSIAFAPPEQTTTTTTTTSTTPTTSAATPPTVVEARPTPPEPPPTLPRTGGETNGPAYAGTALLVAGIGVLGAIGRRRAA